MTTQNKRRDKTKKHRSEKGEGRRMHDGAKKQTEEMHEEDERDRKGEMRGMTEGVKGTEREEGWKRVKTRK